MKFCGIKINGSALLCGGLLLSSVSSLPITGLVFAGSLLGASALRCLFYVDDTQDPNHQGTLEGKLVNAQSVTAMEINFEAEKFVVRAHANGEPCTIKVAMRSGAPSETYTFPDTQTQSKDLQKLKRSINDYLVCSRKSNCPIVANKLPEDLGTFREAEDLYMQNHSENPLDYEIICRFSESWERYEPKKAHRLHSECSQISFEAHIPVTVLGHQQIELVDFHNYSLN